MGMRAVFVLALVSLSACSTAAPPAASPSGPETVTITVVVAPGLADGTVLANHAEATTDNNGFVEDDEPTTIADPSLTHAQLPVQKAVTATSGPASAILADQPTDRNAGTGTLAHPPPSTRRPGAR